MEDGSRSSSPWSDNDDEVDGDPVTVTVVDQSGPRHGDGRGERHVIYTPDDGYDGEDAFAYRICDPDGDCDQATVSVEVSGSTAPPTAPETPDVPQPEPQPGLLPHTGGDVARLALWGMTLLLVGVALVTRRPRAYR